MGVTLACFHEDGTLPLVREKSNKSDTGEEIGCANSLRMVLLIESGPENLTKRCRNSNIYSFPGSLFYWYDFPKSVQNNI